MVTDNKSHRIIKPWQFVLLVIACLSTPTLVSAEDVCKANALSVIQQAYPNAAIVDEYGRIDLNEGTNRLINKENIRCKIWPTHPDRMLMIMKADTVNDLQISYEAPLADLVILVAANPDNKLIASFVDKNALDSDAIYVSDILLDTARYRLNETTTAFGIRVNRIGSSRANPYSNQVLSLFTVENNTIQRKLNNLIVESSSGQYDGTCAGEYTDSKSIILIGDRSPNNAYANLIVKSTITDSAGGYVNNDCDELYSETQNQQFRLKFGGTEYSIPEDYQW